MNILFRADSSFKIGTGHIMRDIVLANKYKKDTIYFAVQDLEGNINSKIVESRFNIKILQSNNIKELDKLIKKLNIDMIVFDHYGIDFAFEKKIKINNPNIKILSFDDTYEKHYCDILLNHNISGDPKKYKGLVPKKCELRCGSKYTLLRDEFYIEKKRKSKKLSSKKRNKKKTVFIAMGGADHSNINIDILKVVGKFKNLNVNLVTTSANKNLKQLKKYCKNKKSINLHINSNKVAKLMGKSDFAIVTPSVTVNETFFMELPFIAIKTAQNQKDIYKYLKSKKFLTLKKFNKNRLKAKILKIIQ